MPLALIVVTTVLAHAAYNGSRLAISLNALSMGASALTVGVLMSLFAAATNRTSTRTGTATLGWRTP